MKNPIRFLVLSVFVSFATAQTVVYLEVERRQAMSYIIVLYDLPEERKIRTDLLKKADQEGVPLSLTRKDSDADYILMIDGKGWAIESVDSGEIVGQKKKARRFSNTIKDIVNSFKDLEPPGEPASTAPPEQIAPPPSEELK